MEEEKTLTLKSLEKQTTRQIEDVINNFKEFDKISLDIVEDNFNDDLFTLLIEVICINAVINIIKTSQQIQGISQYELFLQNLLKWPHLVLVYHILVKQKQLSVKAY